jgi:site-specific recombinase XerD
MKGAYMNLALTTEMDNNTTIRDAVEAYVLSLQSADKSERTIVWYAANLLRFDNWLQSQGMAGVLGDLLIPVAEAYLADRRSNGSKTSTRHGDAMSIKAFGSWLANNRK